MNPAPIPVEPLTSTPLPDVDHLAELRAIRQAGVNVAFQKAKATRRNYVLFEHCSFHGADLTAMRFEVEHIEDTDEPELVGFLIVPTKLLRGGAR